TYLYATNPRFEEDEFAPLMAQLNAILPNYVKQPDYVISKEVTEKAFNNPRRLVLSMEMLEKVNLAAMKRVYNNIFSNYKDAILVITGNVALDTIKPVVEKYIGALPVGKEAQGYIDRNMVIVNGSFEDVFDYEMQTPKSTIMGIYSGDVKYTTEAFYTAQAVNYILDMLYTDTIREEEGASYGVATNADITYFPTGKATILFQFDTDPALAKNMTDLAIKGLEQLATNGPTEEYVERAKENFKKLLPETRISNGYWEEMLTMNYLFGLDRDSEAEAAINAITADSIKQFVADIISQGNRKIFIMNPK
ncbi:MAG: insulinase family protein, partial [Bacteroidales bacterium]|nr:insulinase family protein [Bacteroidales bacterium]